MSRGSWAKRNEWDDRNSYLFGINASYFRADAASVYIPVAGSIAENPDPASAVTQFIPGGSGRLVSLTTYCASGTAPGSTVIKLNQMGPGELGAKTISIASQTIENFTFRDELTSGTFEWDINDGTSLGIQFNPTNNHDNMNVFALFEIYR